MLPRRVLVHTRVFSVAYLFVWYKYIIASTDCIYILEKSFIIMHLLTYNFIICAVLKLIACRPLMKAVVPIDACQNCDCNTQTGKYTCHDWDFCEQCWDEDLCYALPKTNI